MTRLLISLLCLLLAAISAEARKPRDKASGTDVSQPCVGGPTLTPGVWTNITPPAAGIGSSNYGTISLAIDPHNHGTLYGVVDTGGLWKTTNCGNSWTLLGKPPAVFPTSENNYTTPYLDSPIEVLIDPADSTHLVATQGVRGTALGFWISHDSGATWRMPGKFFKMIATTTNDVTEIATDPSNWNHMIMTGHSPWPGYPSSGVMETTDAGVTWTAHAPHPAWTSNTHFLAFLYDPATSQGNSSTWLLGDPTTNTYWRTTDSGANWTQVASFGPIHGGGNRVTYAPNGIVYTGSSPYPLWSNNNGVTWNQVNSSGLPRAQYYFVGADGSHLYVMPGNAVMGTYISGPYFTAPESTGNTSAWTQHQGGAQTFINGPFQMYFDSTNGLMYSANWSGGLWVLKTAP